MSLFATDKTQLILWVLDHYQVKYNPNKYSNQKISCLNYYAHPHGDRNPSASVSLEKGMYHCFACGTSGDGYSIMKAVEGWGVKQVNEAFGGELVNEVEGDVWI